MSLRECWINVYSTLDDIEKNQKHRLGFRWRHKDMAEEAARSGYRHSPAYRIHIRLKPEGAPRRYASEHDRRNWETYPEEMRKCPF